MSRKNMIPISGERLKKEIYKRGFSLEGICKAEGWSDDHLSRATKRNSISEERFDVLYKNYGIPGTVKTWARRTKSQKEEPVIATKEDHTPTQPKNAMEKVWFLEGYKFAWERMKEIIASGLNGDVELIKRILVED